MRNRITLKQIAKCLDYILSDTTSGFATLEERALIKKANEEREILAKLVTEQIRTPWYERDEYQRSGYIKQLWLAFKYAFWYDRRGESKIPNHVLKNLARVLLPDIISFFESDEGKCKFEEWKKEQAGEMSNDIGKSDSQLESVRGTRICEEG